MMHFSLSLSLSLSLRSSDSKDRRSWISRKCRTTRLQETRESRSVSGSSREKERETDNEVRSRSRGVPYRMLIKRVSTVSKYPTAAAARGVERGAIGRRAARGPRYSFRGAVVSLMYASGLARWSAAPCGWSTSSSCQGTPLCYGHCYVHYILSRCRPPPLSLFLSLAPSRGSSLPASRSIAAFRSLARLPLVPSRFGSPLHGVIRTREFSLFLTLVLQGFPPFLSSSPVSSFPANAVRAFSSYALKRRTVAQGERDAVS